MKITVIKGTGEKQLIAIGNLRYGIISTDTVVGFAIQGRDASGVFYTDSLLLSSEEIKLICDYWRRREIHDLERGQALKAKGVSLKIEDNGLLRLSKRGRNRFFNVTCRKQEFLNLLEDAYKRKIISVQNKKELNFNPK